MRFFVSMSQVFSIQTISSLLGVEWYHCSKWKTWNSENIRGNEFNFVTLRFSRLLNKNMSPMVSEGPSVLDGPFLLEWFVNYIKNQSEVISRRVCEATEYEYFVGKFPKIFVLLHRISRYYSKRCFQNLNHPVHYFPSLNFFIFYCFEMHFGNACSYAQKALLIPP